MIKKKTVVMMNCLYQQTCKYHTDLDIPKENLVGKKQLQMQLHIGAMHAAPPPMQPSPVAARMMEAKLVQARDEAITSFETRLTPLARRGKFKVKYGS